MTGETYILKVMANLTSLIEEEDDNVLSLEEPILQNIILEEPESYFNIEEPKGGSIWKRDYPEKALKKETLHIPKKGEEGLPNLCSMSMKSELDFNIEELKDGSILKRL